MSRTHAVHGVVVFQAEGLNTSRGEFRFPSPRALAAASRCCTLSAMAKLRLLIVTALFISAAFAHAHTDGDFRIALPEHNGQLICSAPGFNVDQSSAKPGRGVIGL